MHLDDNYDDDCDMSVGPTLAAKEYPADPDDGALTLRLEEDDGLSNDAADTEFPLLNDDSTAAAVFVNAKLAYDPALGAGTVEEIAALNASGVASAALEMNMQLTTLCGACGSLIKNAGNVEVHMRRHLGYRPYVCSACRYAGFDPDDVRRHINRLHPGQGSRVTHTPTADMESSVRDMIASCRTVGAGSDEDFRPVMQVSSKPTLSSTPVQATSTASLTRQLLESSPTNSVGGAMGTISFLKCSLCAKSVPGNRTALVLQHLRSHLTLPSFACPVCDQAISDCFEAFEVHVTSHDDADTFSRETTQAMLRAWQDTCWREFATLAELAFEGSAKVKCALCSLDITWTPNDLTKHVQEHASFYPYKCTYCATPFLDQMTLAQHIKSVHPCALVLLTMQPRSYGEKTHELHEKCFPMFTAQAIERLDAEKIGDSFTGTMAFLDPTDPDLSVQDAPSIQCKLCVASIAHTVECVVGHAKVHLGYKPLKCSMCAFRHHAMSKIRRHIARMHPGKAVTVSNSPIADIGKRIKDMLQRCFGSHVSLGVAEIERRVRDDEESPSRGGGSGIPATSSSTPGATGIGTPGSLLRSLVTGGSTSRPMPSFTPGNPDLSNCFSVGKKMCSLCSTYIANNPSSFENHACKHLDYKPFHCHYCQYQSYIRGKVTRHIQQVHHGLQIKINHEPVAGIKDKIQAIKLKCFPFLVSGYDAVGVDPPPTESSQLYRATATSVDGTTSVNMRKSVCQLCGTMVGADQLSKDEHLQQHIISKHFWCPVCTFNSQQLFRTKQHIHTSHPDQKITRVLCCPPEGPSGLEKLRHKCFGISSTDGSACDGLPVIKDDYRDDSEERSLLEDSIDGSLPVERDTALAGDGDVVMIDDDLDCDDDSENAFGGGSQSQMGLMIDEDEMTGGLPEQVTCSACGEVVANQPSVLNNHVRSLHLDYRPYQCAYCALKSATEAEVKQHITASHKGAPLKVIYHPERTLLARMQEQCFPTVYAVAAKTSPSEAGPFGVGHPAVVGSSMAGMKKLVCQLCRNTIADNPKSMGIHVKNHLNYKPYKCPYCKYMSCEQSKARRHIEHVHGKSAEHLEVSTDEGIKEKIADMKSKCFPNLGQVGVIEVYGSASSTPGSNSLMASGQLLDDESLDDTSLPMGDGLNYFHSGTATGGLDDEGHSYQCRMCHEHIPVESIDYHCRTHVGKPYKCSHCASRFWTEDKFRAHAQSVHPSTPAKMVWQRNHTDPEAYFHLVKRRCFPDVEAESESPPLGSGSISATPIPVEDDQLSLASYVQDSSTYGSLRLSSAMAGDLSKITCRICDQTLAGNANSMDVHVKNHLNYKPHQCGYCEYRSCIPGKVKRHLDTVHRGQEPQTFSFTQSSTALKQILQEMKSLCFPQHAGLDDATVSEMEAKSKAEMLRTLEQLRVRLLEEVQTLMAPASGLELTGSPTKSIGYGVPGLEDELSELPLTVSGGTNGAGANPMTSIGRLHCAACGSSVADNPSSIGLHVRNHLNYRPYRCALCTYRSCIQAKVKRHLANVHKLSGNNSKDMLIYEPEPEIRDRVTEMRRRCFPRITEANHSSASAFGGSTNGDDALAGFASIQSMLDSMLGDDSHVNGLDDDSLAGDDSFDDAESNNNNRYVSSMGTSSSLVTCQLCHEVLADYAVAKSEHLVKHVRGSKLSPSQYDQLLNQCFPLGGGIPAASMINGGASDNATSAGKHSVTCQLCGVVVDCVEAALKKHIQKHMNSPHYRCPHCPLTHLRSAEVKNHVRLEHGEQAAMKIAQLGADIAGSDVVWMTRCFPDLDLDELDAMAEDDLMDEEAQDGSSENDGGLVEDGVPTRADTKDGPRYICQLCKLPVSMYASSLYTHVKNHIGYKPYSCPYCDYCSPVKSKVRRHLQNAHKNKPGKINYNPTVGIDHDILLWKRKCFPEVASLSANVTNNKVPCMVCQSDVADTLLSKSVHAKNHLDAKPYHCGYCTYKSCLKGETRRHVNRQHPGQPMDILYFEEELASQTDVDNMIERCFSSILGATGKVTSQDDDEDQALSMPLANHRMASVRKNTDTSLTIKLGPAFREWFCVYCPMRATSKYSVKQHCLQNHPGQAVDVSEIPFTDAV